MLIIYSEPLELTKKAICSHAPEKSGIYKITQNKNYPCYHGQTDILKYGLSKKNLRNELLNHIGRHTCANRIKRIKEQTGVVVFFSYAELSEDEVDTKELDLLRDFERRHWQSPILNSTRGFKRGEDRDWD